MPKISWYEKYNEIKKDFESGKSKNFLDKKYGTHRDSIKKVIRYLGLTNEPKDILVEDALEHFINKGSEFPATEKYLREQLSKDLFFGFCDHSMSYILHKDDYASHIIKSQCPDEPWRLDFSALPEIVRKESNLKIKVCYYKSTRTGEEVWGETKTLWSKNVMIDSSRGVARSSIFGNPTTDEICRVIALRFHDRFGSDKFEFYPSNNVRRVKIKCKRCGRIFERSSNILCNKGAGIKCECTYDTDWFISKANEIYPPGLFGYNRLVYHNSNNGQKVEIRDLRTGEYFWITARSFLKGRCLGTTRMSSGERNVNSWLKLSGFEENIDFQRDPYIKFLVGRGSGLTRIDFILNYQGKQYWIEYNGKQHYEFLRIFFDTHEEFEAQVRRDKEEREYCEKNNITLISIPYTYNSYKKVSELLKSIIIEGKSTDIIKQVEVKL